MCPVVYLCDLNKCYMWCILSCASMIPIDVMNSCEWHIWLKWVCVFLNLLNSASYCLFTVHPLILRWADLWPLSSGSWWSHQPHDHPVGQKCLSNIVAICLCVCVCMYVCVCVCVCGDSPHIAVAGLFVQRAQSKWLEICSLGKTGDESRRKTAEFHRMFVVMNYK